MPTYILRRSPETDEYLLWSTVVDAPVSHVMTRDEALSYASAGLGVDADLAAEHARRRLERTDAAGTSEHGDPHYGYRWQRVWWRDNAPESFGEPYEDEDYPGTFIGREGSRDELFDVCREPATT